MFKTILICATAIVCVLIIDGGCTHRARVRAKAVKNAEVIDILREKP